MPASAAVLGCTAASTDLRKDSRLLANVGKPPSHEFCNDPRQLRKGGKPPSHELHTEPGWLLLVAGSPPSEEARKELRLLRKRISLTAGASLSSMLGSTDSLASMEVRIERAAEEGSYSMPEYWLSAS